MKKSNDRAGKVIKILGRFFCATLVKRIICVVLLAFDVDIERIQGELGLSYKSIKKYERMLDSSEYEDIIHMGEHNRASELDDFKDVIFAELDSGAYHTLHQIAVMIKEKTGLERSRNRIQIFLRKHGYKPLKVGFFPCESKWGKTEGFLQNDS